MPIGTDKMKYRTRPNSPEAQVKVLAGSSQKNEEKLCNSYPLRPRSLNYYIIEDYLKQF